MDDSSLFLVRAGTRASAAGMGRFGAWAAEAWLSPTHSTPLNRLDKQKFFVVGIGLFSRRGAVKEDTAIGILFAAALALGVVLISTVRSYAVDLTHILFGNVLGVSAGDLWLTGILAAAVLATVKAPLCVCADPV